MPGRRTTTKTSRKFRGKATRKYSQYTRTSLSKLSKQVRALTRKEKRNHQYLNYSQKGVFLTTSEPYQSVNLCDYLTMTTGGAIFGADGADDDGNQMIHKGMGIHCYVDLENINGVNEEGTIQFSAFLVSLKDCANNGTTFNPASGALTLVENVDYMRNYVGAFGKGGMFLLNKKKFTIHKKKFFTLSNREQSLGISASYTRMGTNCQWYWKLKPQSYIKNPAGNWSSLQSALDPSKQYYLILFNNNELLDGEAPQWQYSAIHTIQTLGQ